MSNDTEMEALGLLAEKLQFKEYRDKIHNRVVRVNGFYRTAVRFGKAEQFIEVKLNDRGGSLSLHFSSFDGKDAHKHFAKLSDGQAVSLIAVYQKHEITTWIGETPSGYLEKVKLVDNQGLRR